MGRQVFSEESYTNKPGNLQMRVYPICVGANTEALTVQVKNLLPGPGRLFTARDDRGTINLGQRTQFKYLTVPNHGHTLHGKPDIPFPPPPPTYRIPGPLWRTGAPGLSHLVAHYDPKAGNTPHPPLSPPLPLLCRWGT